MLSERTPDGESPKGVLYWTMAKAGVVWGLLTLWIAYRFFARDIPMDARAWSVAFSGGLFVIVVQTSIGQLILRDPPKSLSRRLLTLAGAVVLASFSLVIWVLTLGWLEAAP